MRNPVIQKSPWIASRNPKVNTRFQRAASLRPLWDCQPKQRTFHSHGSDHPVPV
jgi:hypothetical protein